MEFPEARVRRLLQNQSDHYPFLIAPNGFAPINTVKRPFRFQAAWLTHEKFKDCLEESWRAHVPLHPLLHQVVDAFDKWNAETFGNLFRRKRIVWARLEGIQRSLSQQHNSSLIKLEAKWRRDLDEVLNQTDTLWFQKSRTEAIRDGDRNTRYYYLSTIMRRKLNRIEALQDAQDN